MKPKTFISYCTADQTLAKRLKDDLERAGCDAWQFDLSAIPGTDAWAGILDRIEKSDFFIVLLSKGAAASRAVQEEVSHAHYCSINHAEGRPRIIPLLIDDDVAVPRQIVRAVRLQFRKEQYNGDFERLLKAIGIDSSPFAATIELDVTFSRGRAFEIEREAGVFAANLISNHSDISAKFSILIENIKEGAGGRWRMPSPQTIVWEAATYRHARQPQFWRKSEYKILVFFPLHFGHSSGYESNERVVIEIAAFDDLKFDYVADGDVALHSDTLRLKFEGFRDFKLTT